MNNPYIYTNLGVRFHFFDLNPDEVHLEDIAHGLSHICRWVGQCDSFYSVAAHSLLVAEKTRLLAGTSGDADELVLAALLHDAAEAYLGDFSGPLKDLTCFSEYVALHDNILRMIYHKFGVTFPSTPKLVRAVDQASRLLENEALFRDKHSPEDLGVDPTLYQLWTPWEVTDVTGLVTPDEDKREETYWQYFKWVDDLSKSVAEQYRMFSEAA